MCREFLKFWSCGHQHSTQHEPCRDWRRGLTICEVTDVMSEIDGDCPECRGRAGLSRSRTVTERAYDSTRGMDRIMRAPSVSSSRTSHTLRDSRRTTRRTPSPDHSYGRAPSSTPSTPPPPYEPPRSSHSSRHSRAPSVSSQPPPPPSHSSRASHSSHRSRAPSVSSQQPPPPPPSHASRASHSSRRSDASVLSSTNPVRTSIRNWMSGMSNQAPQSPTHSHTPSTTSTSRRLSLGPLRPPPEPHSQRHHRRSSRAPSITDMNMTIPNIPNNPFTTYRDPTPHTRSRSPTRTRFSATYAYRERTVDGNGGLREQGAVLHWSNYDSDSSGSDGGHGSGRVGSRSGGY